MNRKISTVASGIVALFLMVWSISAMAQKLYPQEEIRFQNEIKEMLRQDTAKPPASNGIVFTGSSIFRFWSTLGRDMAPLPVLNRAFGGARTWEVLHYMDAIILPLKPSIIVYYCGGNDIEFGASADEIAQGFSVFCRRAHAALPKAKIFYMSLNKAPLKFEKWAIIDTVNRRVQAQCAMEPRLHFIDINPEFMTENGLPRRELFISDGLHFMPNAYKAITRILKPALEETWHELQSAP